MIALPEDRASPLRAGPAGIEGRLAGPHPSGLSTQHFFPFCPDFAFQDSKVPLSPERKMLAIGRGLMKNPEILLPDEPSEGWVPLLAV
jgi:hypothetical protein